MNGARPTRDLLKATLPMFAGLVFVGSVGLVDAFWVAKLGVEPLAAFSCALPLVFFLQNLLAGFSAGVTSVGARCYGAGNLAALRFVAHVSFKMLVGGGALTALLSFLFREQYLAWVGAEARVAELASDYLLPILPCIVLYSVCLWGISITRAVGDLRFTAGIMFTAAALNFVLCPLAVFGWGPVPALGLLGAGYAMAAAFTVAALFSFLRMREFLTLDPAASSPVHSWREVLAEAGPATVTNALWPVGAAIMLAQVGRFGPGATAAMGIIGRVEHLILMLPSAASAALMPLVAQAWAKQDKGYAALVLRAAQRLALVWGLFAYLVLAAFAYPIAKAFGDDRTTLEATALGLRLIPLSYITGGVMIVTSASLLSIGRPLRTTQLAALVNLVILPVCTTLAGHQFGLTGTYVAFVASIAVGMLLALRWSEVDGVSLGALTKQEVQRVRS